MKSRWIILLSANFANSICMAFILVSMYAQSPHRLLLIEPNDFVITGEAVFSLFIVILTISVAAWNFFEKKP
jgi:hypothetical protein